MVVSSLGNGTEGWDYKKKLLDAFDEEESCSFGEIRLDKDRNAISVPIFCLDSILKYSKQKRLDIIEGWALTYLRVFDVTVWSGIKTSEETLDQLKKLFTFDAVVAIQDQKGNIVENRKIGSYEFGERKFPSEEK